jgi:twitching motility two-component system response regulator PilG
MDQQLKTTISYTTKRVERDYPASTLSGSVSRLLNEGIIASKAGDKVLARALLLRAADADPRSETAWLWLASISERIQERLYFLERVLAINPNNERAISWSSTTRKQLVTGLIQQGIAAAKQDDKATALYLLLQAVDEEPNNETAWLWLASVAETLEDKLYYLHKVLEINPNNNHACKSVEILKQQMVKSSKSWSCPICQTISQKQITQCEECGMVFTLDDIDKLLTNNAVNQELIRAKLNWLKESLTDNSTPSDYYLLGIIYLNLQDVSMGLACLQAAMRLNPSDETLRPHIGYLKNLCKEMESVEQIAQPAKTSNSGSSKLIMVVDDSPTVRKLVAIKLEKHGHRVIPAVDGMDAMAKLNEETPDLILLDVTMPRMDGYQLCKIIKSNEAYKRIPVVMLSGKDGFFDKMRGRMAGSVAYITKPFEPETLLQTVDEYCGQGL